MTTTKLLRLPRRRAVSVPVECLRCGASFRPMLTDWQCPLCAAPAPGRRPGGTRAPSSDDRLVAMVVAATIANVVLLAVLAIAVLHAAH